MSLKLHVDHDREAEYETDGIARIVCWHSKYKLGDEQPPVSPTQWCKDIRRAKSIHTLPVYLHDHTDLTVRTTPFSDPWDSGQVGYVYMTHAAAEENWGHLPKEEFDIAVMKYLKGVVEDYNAYLTGNIWYFEIIDTQTNESLFTVGNFIGEDAARQEGESQLAACLAARVKYRVRVRLDTTIEAESPDDAEALIEHLYPGAEYEIEPLAA